MQDKMNDPFHLNEFIKSFQQSASNPNSSFEMDFSKIEDLIKNSMENIFAGTSAVQNFRHPSFSPDIFETHDYMIVKVPIPPEVNARDISVFFDTNVVMISGLGKDVKRFNLPMNGSYAGCQGYVKDKILEIRIPKNEKKNFREITIRHL